MDIIKDKSETRVSGFYVVFKGSTNLEDSSNYGIAHLMEHLLCKNIDHMMDTFDRNAIEWNAYTSHNEVVFYISGKGKYIDRYKDEFAKSISQFNITQEELDNEKMIVESEYYNSFSETVSAHFQMFMRKHFKNYNPIGELGCIRDITLDDCKKFFDIQFKEPSYIIDISQENRALSQGVAESIIASKVHDGRTYSFSPDNSDFKSEHFQQMVNTDSVIMTKGIITDDIPLYKFASNILSRGLKSPLYDVIREQRGLVYSLGLNGMMLTDNQFMPYFNTVSPKDNIDSISESLKFVHQNIDQLVSFESFLKIKSSLKEQYDLNNVYNATNGQKYITPDNARLDNKIDNIQYSDVLDYIKEELDISSWHISLSSDF